MQKSNNYYKYISHKLLRSFYVVAQEQSITKATEKLFVTQPTISLQIQSLERELNHFLFERRGPKITLTPAGRKLYELVQPIITGFDSLKASFEDSLGNFDNSEISIGVGHSTALYILPKYIQKFKAEFPNVMVKMNNLSGSKLVSSVKSDEVDFSIGALSEIPTGVEYHQFKEFGVSLITPLNHPLAEKKNINIVDIAKYKLIVPPRHYDICQQIDSVFDKHKLKYSVGMQTVGWESVKKYVEMGLGISIISEVNLVGNERLATIPMHQHFSTKEHGLVIRTGKFLSPQAQEFIKYFDIRSDRVIKSQR